MTSQLTSWRNHRILCRRAVLFVPQGALRLCRFRCCAYFCSNRPGASAETAHLVLVRSPRGVAQPLCAPLQAMPLSLPIFDLNFVMLYFESSLSILDASLLSVAWFTNISPQSVACVFMLFAGSSADRAEVRNLDENPCIIFFFLLEPCVWHHF